MFTFLLVVHAIVAAALVGVILMQRSEGGGLAGGGSPAGLMSARGASNFLTRTTTILATLFILLSIGMAALAGVSRRGNVDLDTSLASKPAAASPNATPNEAPTVPLAGDTSSPSANLVPEASNLPAQEPVPVAPKTETKPLPQTAKVEKARPEKVEKAGTPQPAPKSAAPAANTTAPISVPSSMVSPPTPPAERPEPQPEGR